MENPFHSQPGVSTPPGRATETPPQGTVSVPLLEELLQAPGFDHMETEPLSLPAMPKIKAEAAAVKADPMMEAPTVLLRELTQIKPAETQSPFQLVQAAPATAPSPFTMVQAPAPENLPPAVKKPPIVASRRMPKPSIPNDESEPPKKSHTSLEQISSLQLLSLGCLIAVLAILMGVVYDVTQRDGRWVRRYLPEVLSPATETLPK